MFRVDSRNREVVVCIVNLLVAMVFGAAFVWAGWYSIRWVSGDQVPDWAKLPFVGLVGLSFLWSMSRACHERRGSDSRAEYRRMMANLENEASNGD